MTVNRRSYMVALGSMVLLAGCIGENAEISETVRQDGQYNFDAEADDTITIEVDNEEGFMALVDLMYDEENILSEEVETSAEFEVSAPGSGVYTIWISGDRVDLSVYVD